MSLIEKAIDIALRAHAGQTRKHSGLPYILHPAEVASHVRFIPGAGQVQIAAAWLHDVIEDCGPEFALEIGALSNPVYGLVLELTNPSKGSRAPRAERKAMDRKHIAKASTWAKNIKLIDRWCNLHEMAVDFHANRLDLKEVQFLKLYMEESKLLDEAINKFDAYWSCKLRIQLGDLKLSLSEAGAMDRFTGKAT